MITGLAWRWWHGCANDVLPTLALLTGVLPFVSLGFALGLTHAADADHVVAVSTMVGERRARPVAAGARVGMFWGLGHTLTVLSVGGAMVLTRAVVPERVSQVLELGVAVMLVVLGALTLRAWRLEHPAPAAAPHGVGPRSPLRSLGVGAVHGLAGSAAVALGVLAQTTSAAAGLGYLVCFGAGTLVGMMALTTAMAVPLAAAGAKWGGVLRAGAGVLSIALGVVLFGELTHALASGASSP